MGCALPFHSTTELDKKFCPVMLNVNAAVPALAEFGVSAVITGAGFEAGKGWLPPEPALLEPPPQDDAQAKTNNTKGRKFCLKLDMLINKDSCRKCQPN